MATPHPEAGVGYIPSEIGNQEHKRRHEEGQIQPQAIAPSVQADAQSADRTWPCSLPALHQAASSHSFPLLSFTV